MEGEGGCIDWEGNTQKGDNTATPNSPITTVSYPAIPDTDNPGGYIPYPNAQNPIISGSTVEYSYDGGALFNCPGQNNPTPLCYAGQYYFTITVQDEYHLE